VLIATEETTTSTKPEDDTIEFASDYYEGGEWTGDLKAELTKLGIDDDEIDIGDAVGDTLEGNNCKLLLLQSINRAVSHRCE
jgi:hypothetical protein